LRRAITLLIVALVSFWGSEQAFGADATKVKWLTSIYIDGQGNQLRFPEGVACNEKYFFVADTGNTRLLRYTYDDEMVTPDAEFPLEKGYPINVEVDSKGDLYFLDGKDHRIGIVSPTGELKGFLEPKSLPSSVDIFPRSFKLDDNDNFFILDLFSARVLVLDSEGQFLRQIPFPQDAGFFSDVAVDKQGNIFLLDGVRAIVYSAPKDGDHFSALTDSLKEYMNFPTSMAIAETGSIFLVDQFGSGLALVAQDGTFLGRKLGMGWKESLLFYPTSVCVTKQGKIVIADRSNSRVQVFTLVEK